MEAMRSLQHHIVHVLGAEPLDRWTVEVSTGIFRHVVGRYTGSALPQYFVQFTAVER